MIKFNTVAKAQHYIKYKNKQIIQPEYLSSYECGELYYIQNNKVLYNTYSRCGCGCDLFNSNINVVIGLIKK